MSGRPTVSVIIRTRNRPEFLQEAVRSALDQTFPDREIVVVNDGGEDVASLLESFHAPDVIRYLNLPKPLGRCASGNLAILESRGDYIAYLDDDDLYHPMHLQTLITALRSHEVAIVYTDAYEVHQRLDRTTGRYVEIGREVKLSRDFDPVRFFCEAYIHLVTFCHSRRCFDSLGGFDESLEVLEDLDLFIRYAQDYPFLHLKKVTAEYRIRDDDTNAVTALREEFVTGRERLFSKHAHLVVSRLITRLYEMDDRIARLEELATSLRAAGRGDSTGETDHA